MERTLVTLDNKQQVIDAVEQALKGNAIKIKIVKCYKNIYDMVVEYKGRC